MMVGTKMLADTIESHAALLDATVPERIVTTAHGAELVMTFAGGTHVIAAACLRQACRCAHCTRARIDGASPPNFDAVTIETIAAMGHYGINIGFSDGHARGIYPWAYLASLTHKGS
jgi:DUF971 family protein